MTTVSTMIAVTAPSMARVPGVYRQPALRLSPAFLLLEAGKESKHPGGNSATHAVDTAYSHGRTEPVPSAFAGLVAWARSSARQRNQRVRRNMWDSRPAPNGRASRRESETSHA